MLIFLFIKYALLIIILIYYIINKFCCQIIKYEYFLNIRTSRARDMAIDDKLHSMSAKNAKYEICDFKKAEAKR